MGGSTDLVTVFSIAGGCVLLSFLVSDLCLELPVLLNLRPPKKAVAAGENLQDNVGNAVVFYATRGNSKLLSVWAFGWFLAVSALAIFKATRAATTSEVVRDVYVIAPIMLAALWLIPRRLATIGQQTRDAQESTLKLAAWSHLAFVVVVGSWVILQVLSLTG